jgi:histidinol-phosphate aminotransferase
MRLYSAAFRELGLQVVDSEANFVMLVLESEAAATVLTESLLRDGIIIRPLKAFGLPHCVRISTGSDEDNERCVAAVQQAIRATSAVP